MNNEKTQAAESSNEQANNAIKKSIWGTVDPWLTRLYYAITIILGSLTIATTYLKPFTELILCLLFDFIILFGPASYFYSWFRKRQNSIVATDKYIQQVIASSIAIDLMTAFGDFKKTDLISLSTGIVLVIAALAWYSLSYIATYEKEKRFQRLVDQVFDRDLDLGKSIIEVAQQIGSVARIMNSTLTSSEIEERKQKEEGNNPDPPR